MSLAATATWLKRQRSFYGWPLLAVMWLVMAINLALPLYGASILNPYMGAQLHLSRAMVGVVYAVLMIMTGLPGPLVAVLIDRVGIRWTMVIGNLMLVAGAVWMAAAVRTGLGAILACGIVIGLSDCIGGPIPMQQAVAYWFVRRRALTMAILLSGGSIGGFFAAPLLDWVTRMAHGDWRMGWWLIAACGVVAVLISALFVHDRPSDVGQFPDGAAGPPPAVEETTPAISAPAAPVYVTTRDWTAGEALRSPTLWILMASALGFSCSITLVLGQGVAHMLDRGITPTNAALALSISVAAGFIAHAIVGVLGDYVEPRLLWAGALLVNAAGMLAFIWIKPGAELFLSVALLGAGGSASMICMITLLANYYGAKAYAGVFGLASGVQSTLGALAPVVAGYVYDRIHSYTPVFAVVAAMCLLGGLAMLLLARPPRRAATA
ncbi:MAG: MFS transporter [Caulobacteraceae bacterium]